MVLPTAGRHLREYLGRVPGGRTDALPALAGLIALCAFFGLLRPAFFSPGNVANLFTQGAAVSIIAMGLIFVLLIGEIDLSVGFTCGVCAAVIAVLLNFQHWPWYGAVAAALVAGLAIGLLIGLLVSKVGIPSFVVTLAAFLALHGGLLLLTKGGTNISVRDHVVIAIANSTIAPPLGWLLCATCVGAYAAAQFLRRGGRSALGLATEPVIAIVARVAALATAAGVAVHVLNIERGYHAGGSLKGVPVVVPVVVILLVGWTFVLRRTAFGRHVYAVGGNREAARRAGINVDRIRISAFVICSVMAAAGGVVAASRTRSVDATTGGSHVLLSAIGAAVIGGTSLFGGRGRMINGVIGAAIVAVIDNGMGLLGSSVDVKYVATALVLLGAASVDALSHRRNAASGGVAHDAHWLCAGAPDRVGTSDPGGPRGRASGRQVAL